MSDIAIELIQGTRGNKAAVAAFFGVSLPMVDKWVRDGMPVVTRGGRGVSWVIDLHDAARWRYEVRDKHGRIDPETLGPGERKLWYDGETRRIELQKTTRELIPASEVQQTVSTGFSAVAQALLALPDNLERRAGLTVDQSEVTQAVVHEALQELAERLSTIATVDE